MWRQRKNGRKGTKEGIFKALGIILRVTQTSGGGGGRYS